VTDTVELASMYKEMLKRQWVDSWRAGSEDQWWWRLLVLFPDPNNPSADRGVVGFDWGQMWIYTWSAGILNYYYHILIIFSLL